MNPYRTEPAKNSGMSLIEVVIAIAISAFILASAASFIVSITDIWAKREQRYAFYEHADGVTQFLKTSFRSSGALSETTSDSELNQNDSNADTESQSDQQTMHSAESENQAGATVIWKVPPFRDSNDEALLYFQLPSITPLLTKANSPLPAENRVYISFDKDDGLSLLHRSGFEKGIEDDEINEDDFSRTLLSPFVELIEYIYWDAEGDRWEIDGAPIEEEGSDRYRLPNYLKLTFAYKDTQIERIIPIPARSKHLILY